LTRSPAASFAVERCRSAGFPIRAVPGQLRLRRVLPSLKPEAYSTPPSDGARSSPTQAPAPLNPERTKSLNRRELSTQGQTELPVSAVEPASMPRRSCGHRRWLAMTASRWAMPS
jgi:hypothetical protein